MRTRTKSSASVNTAIMNHVMILGATLKHWAGNQASGSDCLGILRWGAFLSSVPRWVWCLHLFSDRDSKLGTAYHGALHRFHSQLWLNRAVNRKVLKGHEIVVEKVLGHWKLFSSRKTSRAHAFRKHWTNIPSWHQGELVFIFGCCLSPQVSPDYLSTSGVLTKLQMARHVLCTE